MKKYTASYLLTCVVLLFLALAPTKAKASHAAGGEIIYEWVSDSTYRFFFKFYRDCTGINEPPSQSICMFNPCTNFVKNVNMTKYTGLVPPGVPNGSPVSPGCSSSLYPTKCDDPSSPLPGYREWWYTCVEKLEGQCDAWKFTVSIGARNAQNNIVAGNFHVETTFNNDYAQGNSSPYFSIKPIPFCCINQQFSYNNGAVDPNGDSLSNEVINPLNGSSCQGTAPLAPLIAQTPVISFPTNPLQTNNTYLISATTGGMTFTPTQAGPSTMTIRTKEWRNSVLIGSIMRDVQVQVLTNCNFTPPVFPPLNNTNVVGGVLMPSGQVRGCVDQQLKFDYYLTSTDPDAILIGTDNHATSIGGNSNVVYTNSKTNNVKGTFTWTPAMNQTGNYTLSINLIDSTCRPPGILYSQTFSIPIYINGPVVASADTSVCPGDPAQLTVSGLGTGNYTWTVLPGGDMNSLSATSIPNPVASPYATSTYEVYSALTSYCLHNRDQVKVTTLPSPKFTPVADVITCPGKAVVLDPQIVPDPGVTFNAKWTPNTYLSSNTALTPTSTPFDNITYTVVIGASNTQCKGFDTVFVDVLDGFKLSNIDTQICEGESVTINITGDSRYTYEWETNDKSGGTSISDKNIMNPIIKPSPVGKFFYRVKASFEVKPGDKCNDSISEFDIDVQPIPTAKVGEDAIVCYGDTMKLGALVTPAYDRYTYTWSPGQSLDNPNKIDPIFSAFNTTTLTFTASTPAGCKGSDEITLNVLPSDFIFLSADTAICPGEKANIFTETVGIKSFYWGDAEGLKDSKALNPVVSPVTTQVYTIYGRDTNSCYDTQMIKVTVRPRAMIDLPGSIKLYPGESYQMAPGGNGVVYNWFPPVGLNDPNIANPIAKPEVNTRYFVTAMTESGCSASDTIDVLVAPDSYIDMPNAFAPGGKSTLKPIRLGDATLKSFTIFNRWGQKMFESSDINQGWDGRYKEEAQPMGVYVYTIEAVTPAGRKFTKQGNITLIR